MEHKSHAPSVHFDRSTLTLRSSAGLNVVSCVLYMCYAYLPHTGAGSGSSLAPRMTPCRYMPSPCQAATDAREYDTYFARSINVTWTKGTT